MVQEGESNEFEWTLNLLHLMIDMLESLKVEVNKKEEQLFWKFSYNTEEQFIRREVQSSRSMRVYSVIS